MKRQTGVSLVELMIALGIGVAIVGTIAQALALTSDGYRRAEALAFMQEQADVAMRFLAQDIRMAGHWGLAGSPRHIAGRSLPGNPNPAGLRLPTRCNAEFVLNLSVAVEISADPQSWGCNANAVGDSDAMALRSLASDLTVAQPPRLQVVSAPGHGALDSAGAHPAGIGALNERRDLTVYGYYVAARSTLFPEQPVLRRLTLSALTTRPYVVDEEVAQGIELLRLAALVDTDADGYADLTLRADDPRLEHRDGDGLPLARIVGVKVWLVVRSEQPGWPESANGPLLLGGQAYTPPDDGRLRFVSTRTITVRNAALTL